MHASLDEYRGAPGIFHSRASGSCSGDTMINHPPAGRVTRQSFFEVNETLKAATCDTCLRHVILFSVSPQGVLV